MKWHRKRVEVQEPDEEVEARMAREAAERELHETRERWRQVDGIGEMVEEIRSGRNGVSFLEDMAEAMRPRPPRKKEP